MGIIYLNIYEGWYLNMELWIDYEKVRELLLPYDAYMLQLGVCEDSVFNIASMVLQYLIEVKRFDNDFIQDRVAVTVMEVVDETYLEFLEDDTFLHDSEKHEKMINLFITVTYLIVMLLCNYYLHNSNGVKHFIQDKDFYITVDYRHSRIKKYIDDINDVQYLIFTFEIVG
jgi:hypothetical protein